MVSLKNLAESSESLMTDSFGSAMYTNWLDSHMTSILEVSNVPDRIDDPDTIKFLW